MRAGVIGTPGFGRRLTPEEGHVEGKEQKLLKISGKRAGVAC